MDALLLKEGRCQKLKNKWRWAAVGNGGELTSHGVKKLKCQGFAFARFAARKLFMDAIGKRFSTPPIRRPP